ncbi:hypothetical protein [Halobaculum marinum]|uniref:SCP2 domain-containing protein n=1 Tax=Halobaculum marinum TaxID=3031996 RepID=A0ABD5WZK5_9EURY|nr:hypothetical protein [Halobaculum sp. DT55]
MISRFLTVAVVAMLVSAGAVAPVAAQSGQPSWSGEVFETLQTGFDLYNDNSGGLDLGPLSSQIENKRVNIYVSDAGETAVYSFRMTGDGKVRDLQQGAHEDASIRMETDRATMESIAAANSPQQAMDRFETAVRDNDIRIKGEQGHLFAQVTWTVLNTLKGLLL